MEVDHVPTLNDRPPSYTHPEPSSSTTAAWEAKSITQKSILALGFRRRAPWMTLRLFAPPGTRPPSTTSAPILLSTSRPVRGEIILSSTEPEEIAALHVDWRGWTPSLGQRSRHDVAYVRVDLPLPDAWDPATGRLPPGDYTIPWELPEGRLPTSYTHGDGSTHTLPPTFVLNGFAGFVQYQLDAVAERRATAPDGRLGSALSLLTSSNTPDARASLICGYLPVSRPAASEYSPGRAKLLREGIEEDDEPDGSDAWEVVHAGGCEVAIPKPLVFPRGEAVRIYYRCHDDAPPPTLAIDQLLTVGSDATVGTGGDDRPVSLIKPMVEATGEAADGPSTGWQRVERECQVCSAALTWLTLSHSPLAVRRKTQLYVPQLFYQLPPSRQLARRRLNTRTRRNCAHHEPTELYRRRPARSRPRDPRSRQPA